MASSCPERFHLIRCAIRASPGVQFAAAAAPVDGSAAATGEEEPPPTMMLDSLPDELLNLVLQQLPARSVERVGRASRALFRASRDEALWLHLLQRSSRALWRPSRDGVLWMHFLRLYAGEVLAPGGRGAVRGTTVGGTTARAWFIAQHCTAIGRLIKVATDSAIRLDSVRKPHQCCTSARSSPTNTPVSCSAPALDDSVRWGRWRFVCDVIADHLLPACHEPDTERVVCTREDVLLWLEFIALPRFPLSALAAVFALCGHGTARGVRHFSSDELTPGLCEALRRTRIDVRVYLFNDSRDPRGFRARDKMRSCSASLHSLATGTGDATASEVVLALEEGLVGSVREVLIGVSPTLSIFCDSLFSSLERVTV